MTQPDLSREPTSDDFTFLSSDERNPFGIELGEPDSDDPFDLSIDAGYVTEEIDIIEDADTEHPTTDEPYDWTDQPDSIYQAGHRQPGRIINMFKGLIANQGESISGDQLALPSEPSAAAQDPLIDGVHSQEISLLVHDTIDAERHPALPQSAAEPDVTPYEISLEEKKRTIGMEMGYWLDQIDRIKKAEASVNSVFIRRELTVPAIRHMAKTISERAEMHIANTVNLGDIGELYLEEEPDAWREPGLALLGGLLEGSVPNVSKYIQTSLKEQTNRILADKAIDLAPANRYIGRFFKKSNSKESQSPDYASNLDNLNCLSNTEAWEIIYESVSSLARLASTQAHANLFVNIAKKDDNSAEHRNESGKAIMAADFDSFVSAIGIREEAWQHLQDDSYITGVNVSYQSGSDDPLDRILERAGQNIRSVKELGYGAFVAIVKAPGPNGDNQRWLVLGSLPKILADKDVETTTSDDHDEFILRNTRSVPTNSAQEAIEMSLAVWELTPLGYETMLEVMPVTGQPFADFRPPIRESREYLVKDIRRRVGKLTVLQDVEAEVVNYFNEAKVLIASNSDREVEAGIDEGLHNLSGAVKTLVNYPELGSAGALPAPDVNNPPTAVELPAPRQI